jgi:hypothetical protein
MNRRPHVPKSGTNVRSLAGPTIARAWPGMALKGRNEPFAADPLNDRNGSKAAVRRRPSLWLTGAKRPARQPVKTSVQTY